MLSEAERTRIEAEIARFPNARAALSEALMIVQRKSGREPHHGMMIPAPQPKALLPNQFSRPSVKPLFQALTLSGPRPVQAAPVTEPSRMARNLLVGNKKNES